MVKQTQTIRRLLPTNCLSVFDHFAGLALIGLRLFIQKLSLSVGIYAYPQSDCLKPSYLRSMYQNLDLHFTITYNNPLTE